MTAEEVCEKYNVKLSTLKANFKRTTDNIYKKYNVKIIKEGRGDKAVYREQIVSDNRAETMFQAVQPLKQMGAMRTDLGLPSFTFNVFLGIITTPMFVFRGSYRDLLMYLMIPINDTNIELLKKSIDELVNAMVLHEIIDTTTDDEIITLSLVRKAEVEMKINVSMIIICKQLAEKNGMQSWIPLLKVWLGTELLSKQEYYNRVDLIKMTGLSEYMVDKSAKILSDCNIYNKTRAYAGFKKCLGLKADMNIEGFYQIDEK